MCVNYKYFKIEFNICLQDVDFLQLLLEHCLLSSLTAHIFCFSLLLYCNCYFMFDVSWLKCEAGNGLDFWVYTPNHLPSNDCFGIFCFLISIFSGLEHSPTSLLLMWYFLLLVVNFLKYFCLTLYLIFAIFQSSFFYF